MSDITVTLKNPSGMKTLISRETPFRIVGKAIGWDWYAVVPNYDGGDETKFDFWAVSVWSDNGPLSKYCAEEVVDEIGGKIYHYTGKIEVLE